MLLKRRNCAQISGRSSQSGYDLGQGQEQGVREFRAVLRATFRQMQTFVLVVETGSFAGAANRLGVSAAAVSDQVRALERKLGYMLFDRRPGTPPVINGRGAAFLRKAPSLLKTANEIEGLASEAMLVSRKVRVGAGSYILDHLLLPNVARFLLEHPATHIEFVPLSSSQEATRAINTRQVDLAYLALHTWPNDRTAEFIGIAHPCLLVSPNHPLAKSWTADGAARLPMVMPLSGSLLERTVVHRLADVGITDFDVVTRAQHPDTIIDLVIAGVGAGYAFREHAAAALEEGRLIELCVQFPPFYRFVFRRPDALEAEQVREVDVFALSLLRPADELDAGAMQSISAKATQSEKHAS